MALVPWAKNLLERCMRKRESERETGWVCKGFPSRIGEANEKKGEALLDSALSFGPHWAKMSISPSYSPCLPVTALAIARASL